MSTRELVPIEEVVARQNAGERQIHRRLEQAWPWLVGPALATHTRLLRVHRGRLLMGCWRNDLIPSVRAAASAAWPAIQQRLSRHLGIRLSHIEVTPCEAPAPPAPKPVHEGDAMLRVLQKLRTLHNQGWTPPKG